MSAELLARLPAKLAGRIRIDDNGCWIWEGSRSGTGYGSVYWEGCGRLTHRLVYTLLVGPFPEALVLDHLCRIKLCCWPKHLEPVTLSENTRRTRTVICPKGHQKINGNCRVCINARDRQRRATDPEYAAMRRSRWTPESRARQNATRQTPAGRAKRAERYRQRRATDPEFRAKDLERSRRRRANPEARAKDAERRQQRWATDPEYRARKREWDRQRVRPRRSTASARLAEVERAQATATESAAGESKP